MRINKNEVLAGQPILKVRELMKQGSWMPWNETSAVKVLGLNDEDTRKLLQILVDQGYIDRITNPVGEIQYSNTIKGNSLGMASAAKPISRLTAEKKLEEFLNRVKEVNINPDYCYFVKKVLLFGSFLTEAKEVNDIDLAVDLENKDDFQRRNIERINNAINEGRRFSNFLDEIDWPRVEVLRFLKARSRVFSIHDIKDQILDKVESKVIYEKT